MHVAGVRGEWVETHSTAGHEHLCTELRQLQLDVMEQLIKTAAADVRGTRMMLAPFPLLGLYCSGRVGFLTADKGARVPSNSTDLPRLRAVLPSSVRACAHVRV